MDVHDHIAEYTHIASITFGSVGIIWNIHSICILSQPRCGSRFSKLLRVLAFVDISYLTLCLVEVLIKKFDEGYPGRNLMNFYLILFPFVFHPGKQILQTSTIILTVIFSLDRYIAVFYPYMIYSVEGCLSTLLRGPKRKHMILYLIGVLIPSTLYCVPHFLEYTISRRNGTIIIDEGLLMTMGMATYYYKLFYYTILDFFIRIIVPVCVLTYTNIKLLLLFKKEISWVGVSFKNFDNSFF